MVSEEPTEGRCNARAGPEKAGYCEAYPVNGRERCRMHGGTNDGAPKGNQNARKHGAFSDHFRSDLTDAEIRALDATMGHLSAIDDERTLAAEVAGEALLKYKRSADSRFLREARQWMSEFNLLPNEDTLNIGGSDGNPLNVLVNREEYEEE